MCVVVVVSDDWTRAFLISLKAVCWKVFESLSTEFIIILLPLPSTNSNKRSGRTWYGNALPHQSSYRIQTLPRSFLLLFSLSHWSWFRYNFIGFSFKFYAFLGFSIYSFYYIALHGVVLVTYTLCLSKALQRHLLYIRGPYVLNRTASIRDTDSGLHDDGCCCLPALHR